MTESFRRLPRAVAIALALAPIAAGAQLGAPAGATPLLPGDAALHGARLQEGTTSYRWVIVREGAEQPLGTLTDALRRVDRDGTPALLRVQTVQRGPGVLVDSTFTRASDLAPLQHRSHQPMRVVELRFDGRAVRGAITPRAGEARQIDTAYALPFFDSGNWDLALRAADLAPGRRIALPVYDPDNGGQVWYSAEVVAVEPDGSWRVSAQLGRGAATLWIDPESRALRRMEMEVGPGVLMRQVPQ